MFTASKALPKDKIEFYRELSQQAKGLMLGETDLVANLANLSALIWMHMSDINWAGFYFVKGQELVLGPFQGKPACIRIPLGKGVCGTAAQKNQIQVVQNVHEFSGHIACDAETNSEIVLPILKKGEVVAVLDIDSPSLARFQKEDAEGLSDLVNHLQETLS